MQQKFYLLYLVLFFTSVNAHSIVDVAKGDSIFYYKLGGAEPIVIPPTPITTSLTLSFTARFHDGLSCGRFDPMLTVTNTLNDISRGVDQAINQLEAAASAAILNLPGYLLQQASPGLYNIMQNGILRASQRFSLATKHCETIQAQIQAGQDPYDDWIQLSGFEDWKASMSTASSTDITDVQRSIDESKGDRGLPWVGGVEHAGREDPPINVISDVTRSGFNLALGRDVTDTTPIEVTENSPELVQIWNEPQQAEEWAREVLGEIHIRTCQGCQKGSMPGKGLIPGIHEETSNIKSDLRQLLIGEANGGLAPTRRNLDRVAAPGVAVSLQLLESIRDMNDDTDRGIAVNVLSVDIAEAKEISKAMLLRRILLTGKKEPHINGNGLALEEIDQAVEEIESEIQTLVYDREIREKLFSPKAIEILQRARFQKEYSRHIPSKGRNDLLRYENGRVVPPGPPSTENPSPSGN